MLSNKTNKANKSKSSGYGKVDTLIGHQTEVVGDVRFIGGLHVEGVVKGNIAAEEDAHDAVAVISEHGRVEGELRVPNLVINGHVTGDVYATEHIDLAKNARVNGDVYYRTIEMASGGEINGKLVRLDQEPQHYLEYQHGQSGEPRAEAVPAGGPVGVASGFGSPEKT